MSFVEDKKIIEETAKFLLNKGYKITCELENSICYENNATKFIIGYDKINGTSGIDLCFQTSKEVFSIGWIAVVRNNIQATPFQELKNIIKLLDYIKNNYEKIVDLSYCLESMALVEEYIKKL